MEMPRSKPINLMKNNKQAKYQCDEGEVPAGQRINPESVLVDGDNLEVVKEFYYLGTVFRTSLRISSEIRRWIVQ